MDSQTPSKAIRVPTNTHPNYYGSVADHQPSMASSLDSRARSYQTALESFAGSYSRASMLYMAENLSVPNADHDDGFHDNINDEETAHLASQKLYPVASENDLGRTLSQRTASSLRHFLPLSRHTTIASVISQQQELPVTPGSTFVQSVFNAVNVLIGVGILALPLAFRCAGWIWGSAIFLFCCLCTNYTAKLLARCLDAYAGATTYGDMGAAAFGDKGRAFIGGVFIFELITINIAMVVLLGDAIQSLYPDLAMIPTRLISFAVLTPTLFFPIRHLAYTSLIGIISCASLVVIVLYDGFSKTEKPGSLWDPMPTETLPSEPLNIPLSFGLMMAGFAGHAVFPTIYRDMEEPKKYDRMVDITYAITVFVYVIMAGAGYLMFGMDAMQEITQNLAMTPGFNKTLNYVAIWLIVFTPIAKYGLMINPLKVSWELWIWSHPTLEHWCKYHAWRKTALNAIARIVANAFIVYFAAIFPGFDRVMSLLGALFSFGISAIFPLVCHLRLFGHTISWLQRTLNWTLLTITVVLASVGTAWSFRPSEL